MHFAGTIPYDDHVTKAMVAGKNIIEYSNGELSKSIKNIWNNIQHEVMIKTEETN
jgi:MinD superfamily P-loop ATPase